MIKAKVNIQTAKADYKPGEIIRERLSDADIAYLRKHDFISIEDIPVMNETVTDNTDFDGFGYPDEGIEYKDEAALQKLQKNELIEYAQELGLELDESMVKADMINAILNYVEEQAAE